MKSLTAVPSFVLKSFPNILKFFLFKAEEHKLLNKLLFFFISNPHLIFFSTPTTLKYLKIT